MCIKQGFFLNILEQIVTMQSDIPDQASYVMEVKVYDDCRLTQTGTVTLTVPNTVNYYNIKHRTKKYVGFMKKKNQTLIHQVSCSMLKPFNEKVISSR